MVKLGQLFSRLVAFCLNLLPWKMNYYFAAALAFIWLDLFRIRKNLIDENITRAFPNISFNEKKIIAKKSIISLCRSFFDVMRIPYLADEWIKHNVIFEGAETIEIVKSEKSGFFFLSLHVGSGDLGAAIVSRCIRPSTLISKRFTNKFLDSFWFDLRQQSETEFINAHGKSNAFDILTALKKGRGTIFVLDQFMGKPYGV